MFKELILIGNNIIFGKDSGNVMIRMVGYGMLTKLE
jgi:hypothetical protein